MLKCYVAPVRLRKWFPPDDPLAELVARLCVLREDLGLEMSGFHQAGLGELDANSEEWRRMYFFRCFVRTMKEITHALGALAMNDDFRAILDKAAPEYQQSFRKTISEMNFRSRSPQVQVLRSIVTPAPVLLHPLQPASEAYYPALALPIR